MPLLAATAASRCIRVSAPASFGSFGPISEGEPPTRYTNGSSSVELS